ncbi:MAG: hypothetical protein JST70_01340 [Bacteroidetes bacterium]|nr:hypothetical protein [Bacteroidota bacterium]
MFRRIGIIVFIAISLVVASVYTGGQPPIGLTKTELPGQNSISGDTRKHLNKDIESTILVKHARHLSQDQTSPSKKKDILLSYGVCIYAVLLSGKIKLPRERISPFLTRLRALLYPKHWFG